MKRIIIFCVILLMCNIGFGQSASDFYFTFLLPSECSSLASDGSDVSWTFTNKTLGCDLNGPNAGYTSSYCDATTIMLTCGEFDNACGVVALVGQDVGITVTVLNGPHAGKKMKWDGKIEIIDGNKNMMLSLEFEVVVPKISVTGTSLCAGETGKFVTATITDGPADMTGYTVDWGDGNISTKAGTLTSTGATGEISTALTSSLTGIQATLRNAAGVGVATSDPYTITVNSKPTVKILPVNPSVCKGLKATLNGEGAKNYVWTTSGTTVGTGPSLTTAVLNSDATYSVVGTSAAGCASDEVFTTVKVKPIPTVTLGADLADVCSGDAVKLTATPTPSADSYTWYNVAGTTNVLTVNPTATTKYGVTATKDGCTSTKAETTVTVHTVSVTISAVPDPVNYSGTTVLTATPTFKPTGGTYGSAKMYTWTGDIDGAKTGATLNSVTSNSLTDKSTFTVEVEDLLGCKGNASKDINISGTALTVTPSGGGTFCSAALPKTLDAGVTGGSGTPSYEWSSTPAGLNFSSTSVEKPDILATSAEGVYTVNVRVTKGIETKDGTVNVTVNKTPVLGTVSATPSSITEGGTSQLTLTTVDPSTSSLLWSSTNGGPLAGTTGLSVSTGVIATAGTYNYKVTADNKGCKVEGNTSVTVTAAGAPLAVNPTGGGSVCSAALPKDLNAGISGGTGTQTIEWTSTPAGLAFSSTSVENPKVQASSTPGVYNVQVKVTKGTETQTGNLTVTINKTPTLGTVSANPSTMEVNNASQLTLTSVDPNTATVKWTGSPLVTNTGLTVSTGTITTANTYTYKVQAESNGCKSEEKSVQVVVTAAGAPLAVTPPATVPSGNVDEPINTGVTVSGGSGDESYHWSSDDPDITFVDKGDGNVSITSPTPGTKEVCVEVKKGTETVKKCFDIVVTEPSEVSLAMTVDKKCAYPGEELTITITGHGDPEDFSFVLRDQGNNPVMTVTKKKTWSTHKVSTTAAGTYTITEFRYTVNGVEKTGTPPAQILAVFDAVPNVKATEDNSTTITYCKGNMLTLKGSGATGVKYTWNHGVTDGVPFQPTVAGLYTVTATDLTTGCQNTDDVTVTINEKPVINPLVAQEVCAGDLVTLTATGNDNYEFTWNNGVINGQPFRATQTADYEVTATNTTTKCSATATTTVTANQPPHIVRKSKNPRNIAIGKDVYFAVTAEGKHLTYQWLKKEDGAWVNMVDNTASTPVILGAKTDSLSMLSVPQSWDGSEFKVVVSGDCGKDSTEFQLGVKECFAISAELVMYEGIIPDEETGNKVDGWYCRGQKIALKAIITSEEGYDIENAHYKWSIDGLDVPQEHVEMESDTAVLTWIPQFTEDDIVIKVCAYCDGACEEICPKYIRLKAREFEDVAMRILTDKDPEHRFCAGDTVNFWIASKNAGEKPVYTWYNDVFELPEQESPRNKVIHYEEEKVTMLMGQEDTWMRVIMKPSPEVCIKEPVVVDTVFMKRKPWVEPSLHIDCSDTLVCKGDSVSMQAIYANAGEQPTFQWQRSIGEPFPDWNLGTKEYAVVHIDEEDVWVKCTMVPSNDVCYDLTKPIVDAIQINVLKANAEVTITCDMEDKQSGDELVFESEVKNILGEPQYEWYIDGRKDPITDSELVTDVLKQGNIVYCMVNGERVCQTRVKSNEIVVDYGQFNRDTMITIYKNERIKNLDMLKEGDHPGTVLFQIEIAANYGVSTITPNGKFDYMPNVGFVGTDVVKYVILNRKDKTVLAEGYIYITVQENDRFFVPNLITPNEDGLNDTWQLDFISAYPNHLIQVFDRNGNVVYEGRNYQNDWKGEGMTKGGYVGHINLVNGVYTYVIDLGDKDKTILKSWLEIRSNLNRRNYR